MIAKKPPQKTAVSSQSYPYYIGPAACGFPNPATDYAESSLSLDQLLIKHPAATFFAKADGDSMEWCGIMDGAVLVVDRSIRPVSGNIIIAIVDGELLVKRFIKKGDNVILASENPAYQPIVLKPGQTLDTWGVVTAAINQFL